MTPSRRSPNSRTIYRRPRSAPARSAGGSRASSRNTRHRWEDAPACPRMPAGPAPWSKGPASGLRHIPAGVVDLNRAHALTVRLDADAFRTQQLHAALARRLQHHHAELLRAEPAGAARMRHRDGLRAEIRKVPADQTRVRDDVRAGERRL